MASAWIEKRRVGDGSVRFRVRYRLGGSESIPKYGGSFRTKRDAQRRCAWVMGELAAVNVPNLRALAAAEPSPTLAVVAERWRASRVDVADGTAATHKVNLARIVPRLGARPVDGIELSDVAAFVTDLHTGGLKRESIRKTLATLSMVLDFADAPLVGKDTRGHPVNAARDRTTVRLPREDRAELNPPTAEHVLAVHRILAPAYRLPLLVLDATGMRIGELEALTWGDVDEPRQRWRVSQTVAKTGQARWVKVPPDLFDAVTALVPREDRTPARPVFQGVTADRLRTAIGRACTAAGIPAFSPHDLRHRRISLRHLQGDPWATIGKDVGQRNLSVTANTYTHVLSDETELDYSTLIRARTTHTPVHTP